MTYGNLNYLKMNDLCPILTQKNSRKSVYFLISGVFR